MMISRLNGAADLHNSNKSRNFALQNNIFR